MHIGLLASTLAASSDTPPQDNGKWVGLVAFVVFLVVAGGMLFLANAYRKNSQNDPNRTDRS